MTVPRTLTEATGLRYRKAVPDVPWRTTAARRTKTKTPACRPASPYPLIGGGLQSLPDARQNGANLAAQEDERRNGDDRDEGEDQRVFGKTLATLIAIQKSPKLRHAVLRCVLA